MRTDRKDSKHLIIVLLYIIDSMKHKLVTHCRVCGSQLSTPFLSLGMMPLPNVLYTSKEASLNAEKLPLEVTRCSNCKLHQLTVIIAPEEMFSEYTYRSGISKGYITHCTNLANELREVVSSNDWHLDIAGNDGTLCNEFQKVLGCRSLNLDPAEIMQVNDVRQYRNFWGEASCKFLEETWPKFKVITATNVLAHVPDPVEFLGLCKRVLSEDGYIVLEFPYLFDMLKSYEFDTIYFEHMSYLSLSDIAHICNETELQVSKVIHIPIHGGSVRVYISHQQSSEIFIPEEDFDDFSLRDFACKVDEIKMLLSNNIRSIHEEGKSIACFGAAAKGNVLLNYINCNHLLSYIIDETPEKQLKYSAGTGLKVYGMDYFNEHPFPDVFLILPWNFAQEIMDKLTGVGFKGKFIVPTYKELTFVLNKL